MSKGKGTEKKELKKKNGAKLPSWPWKLILLLMAMGLGLSLPYWGVKSYAKFLETEKEPKPKDTSYVQILNLPQTIIAKNDSGRSKPISSNTGPTTSKKPAPTGNDSTAADTAFATRISTDSIDTGIINDGWRKKYQARSVINQHYIYLQGTLLAVVVCLLLFLIYFNRLSNFYIRDTDRDAPELVALYAQFKPDIMGLETPRKIKRFSNKVRIQYNLLSYLDMIKPEDDSGFVFMKCLLLLEDLQEASLKPQTQDPVDVRLNPYPDINIEADTLFWLEKQIAQALVTEYDKGRSSYYPQINDKDRVLMRKIYEMNKDIIFQNIPDTSNSKLNK